MKSSRFVLAVIVLIVSPLVFLVCLAAVVQIWRMKEPLVRDSHKLLCRLEANLSSTAQGITKVNDSLAKAKAHLRMHEAATAAEAARIADNFVMRMALPAARQKLAPQINDVRQALNTVTEGAILIDSFLEHANHFPFISVSALDSAGLTGNSDQLHQVADSALEWNALLTDPFSGADRAQAIAARTATITATLDRVSTANRDFETRIVRIRDQVVTLKSGLPSWIQYTSVGGTLFLIWVAMSQVSLFYHGLGWLRTKLERA